MSSFETKNAADGTILRGQVWAAKNPKGVMSLVHGFGEHSGRYANMAAYLNSKNISVVTLDLRGHGRSDGRRGYCPNYGDLLGDVDALLAKSREIHPNLPHILYGHSMGGGLVLNHQLKSSNSDMACIIASAPFIKPADVIAGPQRAIVKFLGKITPKMSLGNKIDGSKISRLPEEQEAYLSALRLVWLKAGNGFWIMPRSGTNRSSSFMLARINSRTLPPAKALPLLRLIAPLKPMKIANMKSIMIVTAQMFTKPRLTLSKAISNETYRLSSQNLRHVPQSH